MTFDLGTVPTYANPFVSFWHMMELCRNRRDCFLSVRANSSSTLSSVCMAHSKWRPIVVKNCAILPARAHKSETSTRRGSRIFEGGGGVQARIQDFSQAPPPLNIIRVTSSDLRKFEKHPHSWTFTSTKHPPPLDIVCVTSSAIRKKIEKHPHSWTFTKGGDPTLGPNVKKPTLWPKGGGGVRTPWTPPPGSATEYSYQF